MPGGSSEKLLGELNEQRMRGWEALEEEWSWPFRKMIGHPQLVARLNWILGPQPPSGPKPSHGTDICVSASRNCRRAQDRAGTVPCRAASRSTSTAPPARTSTAGPSTAGSTATTTTVSRPTTRSTTPGSCAMSSPATEDSCSSCAQAILLSSAGHLTAGCGGGLVAGQPQDAVADPRRAKPRDRDAARQAPPPESGRHRHVQCVSPSRPIGGFLESAAVAHCARAAVGAATAHGVWGWRGPRERRAVLAKAYPGGEDMRVPLRAHL